MNDIRKSQDFTKGRVDAVVVQVVRNGLDSVAEQMAVTLRRTAYSTIIREVLDYATALFDPQGRLIAQSSRIPLFINAMGPTLRFVLEHSVPLEQWEDGDVYLVNDPYLGGSQHLPDLRDVHAGISRGPPRRHCRCDRSPRQRWRLIAGRLQHEEHGHLPGGAAHSARASLQGGKSRRRHQASRHREFPVARSDVGRHRRASGGDADRAARLRRLLGRFGVSTVEACVEEFFNYSERMVRAGLRTIPPGSYEYVDYLDDDGTSDEPIRIQVKLVVGDGEITADFTGTAAQRRSPINGSESMVMAVVQYAVMAAVAPDAPINEGCFRPVRIIAPFRSVVNAQAPAPVVGRIAVCHRCCDVVLGALVSALPGRIPAAYYGMSNILSMSGVWARTAAPRGFCSRSASADGVDGRKATASKFVRLTFTMSRTRRWK